MLSKRELTSIKKALPDRGLHKVAERSGCSYATVQKVFLEPKRYNKEIIYAAIAIIEDEKQEMQKLKLKIKEIVS